MDNLEKDRGIQDDEFDKINILKANIPTPEVFKSINNL